jgi:HK97 family phage major capsid protein
VIVSEELLTDAAFDLEAYLREEFAERIGVLEDTAYLVGDGSAKPTGLLPNVATVTAGAAAAIDFDDVLALIHAVPSTYRRNRDELAFMVNDATVLALSLLKDGNEQYIWQAAVQAGQPDTVRGYPMIENPDMPVVAADARSVLFGNFRRAYLIRDVNGVSFQRLNELYAANGQVGFRAYHRTDGKVREAAAARALVHPSA